MPVASPVLELYRSRGLIVKPIKGGWQTVETVVYIKPFEIEIEKDEENWFIASVPELPGCYTQGRTEEDAIMRIREAIDLALQDAPQKMSARVFGRTQK